MSALILGRPSIIAHLRNALASGEAHGFDLWVVDGEYPVPQPEIDGLQPRVGTIRCRFYHKGANDAIETTVLPMEARKYIIQQLMLAGVPFTPWVTAYDGTLDTSNDPDCLGIEWKNDAGVPQLWMPAYAGRYWSYGLDGNTHPEGIIGEITDWSEHDVGSCASFEPQTPTGAMRMVIG